MPLFIILLCALGLLAGSTVKGVAGIGLPLVAVPVLTVLVNLNTAVTMTTVPIIASNFVQSFQGGRFPHLSKRFWSLLVPLFIAIIASTRLLVVLPERVLNLVIGMAVISIPLLLHFIPHLRVARTHERWANPLVGIAAGILGGISTFYGPPLMLYVFGMRMPKDEFIPAISLMYTVAGVGMVLGIYLNRVATLSEIGVSFLMLIPTAIGMWAGRFVRVQLSERRFQHVLITIYIATGITFLLNALRG
ncbi:MAG: sulfite exporter TauE/SafE family protein [Alphaproteobacteria bacterium]|nr:sulfite exporter TauE/SafE family protein [Alphaproteobacteria bacterium]